MEKCPQGVAAVGKLSRNLVFSRETKADFRAIEGPDFRKTACFSLFLPGLGLQYR